MSDDIPRLNRRHSIGFFVVAAIELGAVVIAGKLFGFSAADILLLRNDAAALFVIGGYLFLLFGIYLLFRKQSGSE